MRKAGADPRVPPVLVQVRHGPSVAGTGDS